MNIKEIKMILDAELPDYIKEKMIIIKLAEDKKVIPMLLEILERERASSDKLLTDINLELSRAHIYIEEAKIDTKKEKKSAFNRDFVLGKIERFYTRYKGIITHCFNRFN